MWVLILGACHRPDPTGDTDDGPPPHSAAHTGTIGVHSGDETHSGLPPTEPDGPPLLSEAGLYADLPGDVLSDGVIAVSPRYPLWTDGAEKRRWLWVPPGTTIDTSDPDAWRFPVGTLAFKEFVRDGVRVETRRMAKEADGWHFLAYLWREDGTDADAVPDGVDDARGTPHDVPSQGTCSLCHAGPGDRVLGVDALQSDAATQAALPLSALVPGEVPGDDATRAALGYLHGNCSGCHRPGALAGDRTGLWLGVAVGLADPAEAAAVVTGVAHATRHEMGGTSVAIVPGAPESSQVWYRMGRRDLEAMPPLGTEVVDDAGREAVRAWIDALPP